MMKFYKQQHEFYCGIDLHANSMHGLRRRSSWEQAASQEL